MYAKQMIESFISFPHLYFNQMESCCLAFKLVTLLDIFSLTKAATPPAAFLLNKRFFVNNLNPGTKMSSNNVHVVCVYGQHQ